MTDTQPFAVLAEQYLALWNEPDADRRRRMIAELWRRTGGTSSSRPRRSAGSRRSPGSP